MWLKLKLLPERLFLPSSSPQGVCQALTAFVFSCEVLCIIPKQRGEFNFFIFSNLFLFNFRDTAVLPVFFGGVAGFQMPFILFGGFGGLFFFTCPKFK